MNRAKKRIENCLIPWEISHKGRRYDCTTDLKKFIRSVRAFHVCLPKAKENSSGDGGVAGAIDGDFGECESQVQLATRRKFDLRTCIYRWDLSVVDEAQELPKEECESLLHEFVEQEKKAESCLKGRRKK